MGRGISGVKGFGYALKLGGNYILEMDADFSHNPKYLTEFWDKIKSCDIVIGSRYMEGGSNKSKFLKRKLSQFAGFYIKKILNLNTINDPTSGYRCFKRRVLGKIDLNSLYSKGPFIITEILYKSYLKNFKIREIPIIFNERKKGKSKLNTEILLVYLFKTLQLKLKNYG